MKTFSILLLELVSLVMLGVVMPACAPAAEDEAPTGQSEQELGSGNGSGYPECPGYGWSSSVPDWKGVRGTFRRTTVPSSGEFSSVTIFSDPSNSNEGAPNYLRSIGGMPESGRVILGVDNPAIGAALLFMDHSLTVPKDGYFVLGQRRSVSGRVIGMCLGQFRDGDDTSVEGKAIMLKRSLF